MAAGFTTWTVLPHKPIEKLSENLWSIEGTMPKGHSRRMVVAKLRDGRLVIHNAVALDDAEMAEIDAFGKVAAIIVPNAFHRQDALIWKQRYPEAKVYCPKKALTKVGQVVAVDGDYSAAPSDDTVQLTHLDGMADAEGVLIVTSAKDTSVAFNDVVLNVEPTPGFMGFLLSPTGRPSVPRVTRWMLVKDKQKLGQHLRKLSALPNLKRVLVGHGANIELNPAATLTAVADEFC